MNALCSPCLDAWNGRASAVDIIVCAIAAGKENAALRTAYNNGCKERLALADKIDAQRTALLAAADALDYIRGEVAMSNTFCYVEYIVEAINSARDAARSAAKEGV
jgi:ABC-type branched-subunit amino acid transport system substrate-binding protein